MLISTPSTHFAHTLTFPTFLPTPLPFYLFFFFNDTATTEIYTLSLHDALPPSSRISTPTEAPVATVTSRTLDTAARSEEHTSELQSQFHLVCRLLLEKKKKKKK